MAVSKTFHIFASLNKTKQMNSIPQKDKTYKFYDDGKTSREYDAVVLRILSKDEAKAIKFKARLDDDNELSTYYDKSWGFDEQYTFHKSLYDIWENAVKNIDWVFSNDTDWFIECSIPLYDEYPIWFVRTNNGGWFSLDIQSSWQGGLLDVDNQVQK